jgi:hypothetical protein
VSALSVLLSLDHCYLHRRAIPKAIVYEIYEILISARANSEPALETAIVTDLLMLR